MVSQWGLSDSKSPQVSRTLLSILADLNNAVVWIVSIRPLISKSCRPFINPLETVPSVTTITDINDTFMFYNFIISRARFRYLFFFSLSFIFTLWSTGTVLSTIQQVSFFCWRLLGLVVGPRLDDPFVSQNPREVCVSHFPGGIYHFFAWTNLKFLNNSQLIIFPTQSCLLLYSFCANLLHRLIMWLFVSPLSSHNLHLLFVASYLFLLWHS